MIYGTITARCRSAKLDFRDKRGRKKGLVDR